MILLIKSPGSPKSFQEAPKKLQKNSGQNSRNIFVGILDETDFHKDILKLNDLPEKDAYFKSIIFQYENFSWIKYNTLFQ